MTKTTFTFELDERQQRALTDVIDAGNYRRRGVPYSLWSVEGERFNSTHYAKEKHSRRAPARRTSSCSRSSRWSSAAPRSATRRC